MGYDHSPPPPHTVFWSCLVTDPHSAALAVSQHWYNSGNFKKYCRKKIISNLLRPIARSFHAAPATAGVTRSRSLRHSLHRISSPPLTECTLRFCLNMFLDMRFWIEPYTISAKCTLSTSLIVVVLWRITA